MPKHEHLFLDIEGLREVLRRIKEHYSTKEELEQEREEIDTLLQDLAGLIGSEASDREQADSDLSSSISSEASAREEADTLLQSSIDNEISNRESADATLQSNIDSIYKLEGDLESGVLIDKLDAHTSYIDTQISNISNALNNLAADYSAEKISLIEFKSGVSSNLESLNTLTSSLQSSLTEEISTRESVDEELRQYIDEKAFVFTFKGYVENYEDLPTEDLSKGDMYYVINPCVVEEVHYPAGTNFVWDGHTWFSQSSSIDLSNYYNKSEVNSLLDTKVGYATVDESTHELVLKSTEESESEIARISGIGGGGGGGSDPELRAEFEAFRDLTTNNFSVISSAMATTEDLEEHENAENPHNITKETIGLDKVLNYSPMEILAPAMEILEDKVDTEDMNDALTEKVSFTDVIDNLVTPEVDKPLSANQGIVLDERIDEVNSRVTSLGAALIFKGTVPSYESLPVNVDEGDCYQIYAEDEQDPHHGEVYAKTEEGWTKIVASAQDMSSLIASAADINRIISDYR